MPRAWILTALMASLLLSGCGADEGAEEEASLGGSDGAGSGGASGLNLGEQCGADSDCRSEHCRPKFGGAPPSCLLAPGYYPHDLNGPEDPEDPRLSEGCGEAQYMADGLVYCSYGCTEAEECVGSDVCVIDESPSGFRETVCLAPCLTDPECGCGFLCLGGACSPYFSDAGTDRCEPEVLPLPSE